MIQNARVSKLYRYLHDDSFRQVMRGVEAALDEGLDHFILDVKRLEEDMRLDLLEAFDVMDYTVDYDPETEEMDVYIE